MAYPEDPDFGSVDALPDPASAPKLSTELEGLAGAIQDTTTGVSGTTSGKTPEEVVAATAAAQQAARDAATNAATAEAAIKILKDAVAAWKKNAPKKAELDKAEKAVTDAKAALATAQQAEDDSLSDGAKALAKQQVKTASDALDKAVLDLQTLQKKRKDADEAYETARKQAAEKMKTLKGGDKDRGGSTNGPTGATDTPDTGTGTGTPAPSSGAGNGRTAPSSGTPAAPSSGKPAGTPAPSSTASPTSPSSTTTSTSSGVDPSTAAIAALLAQSQQPQQAVQMPTQQTTPTATAPQQSAQQPQNQQAKNAKQEGVLDLDGVRELLGETGTGLALGLGGGGSPSTSSTPSPAASEQHGTSFRPAGTPITGTSLGGAPAVNAQAAPTSGTSATGLHTSSDVSGRSTPAATAYSQSPETKTSGATGTGTQAPAGQQQTGARPMGGGMPMMPMTPMAGGAPAGGHRGGDGEEKKITTYGAGGLLHGEDTIAEAVRGGTIAQNKPDAA